MHRTKILIYLAVWKRPEITELCFKGIERLRKHPDYEIQALAVISEEEMIPLCESHEIKWVMHENLPLGKKKNFGLQEAKNVEFDYLMEIGSDDLILNELLDDYKQHLGKDFFGVQDVAYINTDGGECRRLRSKSTYGAGRMISRAVLEKANWKLWTDKIDIGLDNNSVFNLQRLGVAYDKTKPMEFPGVVDIKSQVNLWPFNYFLGVDYNIEEVLHRISEGEREDLLKLIYAEV